MACEEKLQEKADKVYAFIKNYLKEWARSPSRREIIEDLHISTETLAKCYNLLEQQGRAIHRIRGRGRQVWIPIREMREED